ncbi:MAG TPA: RpoL/Rpb11 RNA polymerase subunit family protein [Candidatus Nanoarchaeia archaeon]|nr:RpoL/Rpb11 RNA polymerase subunit family protein [Candidatus Nanoarchaeia archaeon]
MELKFLKEEKDHVIIQLTNDQATIGNLLKDELWITKGVDSATFDKRHPLIMKPELAVHGKDAKKLVKEAAMSIKKKVDEFEKAMLKEL